MKSKTALILTTLLVVADFAFGQAGVGPKGGKYVDYKNTYVDFGSFAISNGAIVGATSFIEIQHTTTKLTKGDILGMYAAPIQLVATPAAGAGHCLTVLKAVFYLTRLGPV